MTTTRPSDRATRSGETTALRLLLVLALTALTTPRPGQAAGQSRDENCGNDNPDISIAACTALIESGPDLKYPEPFRTMFFALGYKARGRAYADKGEYDLAIGDYDQDITLEPNDWGAFEGRGKAYLAEKKYDRAIQDFNEAIRQKPAEAFGAFIGRGDAYFAMGQRDSRLGQWARQGYGSFIEDTNQTARAVQEYDHAIRDYDQAIRLKPSLAFVFQKRGFVYFVKGENDRAIRDYNQAIALNPNDSYYFDLRGEAYEHKGQHARAIQDYDQAIWLNPKDGLAYGNRGFAKKLFMGDTAGGDADLARMQQLK
jgi:tetratricopeptide (TPR) repeat protein